MTHSLTEKCAPILYVLTFFAGFAAACVWFNQESYAEHLPETLLALAALAIVWILYAAASVSSRLRRERAYRDRLVQQESVHPVLHAALHRVEDRPEMLVLAVRNHGKGLAHKVRFEAETSDHPAAHAVARAMAQLPVFAEGLDMLASGETYGGIFADSRTLLAELEQPEFNGLIKLRAVYANTFGDECHAETVLDLSVLNAPHHAETAPQTRKMLLY